MIDDDKEAFDALERDLRRHAPVPLPLELVKRVESVMAGEEPLTMGDRVLATFSSMGAAAACIIAAVAIWQAMSPPAPQITPADVAARQRMNMEYQQLLAAR